MPENYILAEADYIAGMKYKDIAAKYGTTINTVKSWKQRYEWSKSEKRVHTKKSVHTKQKNGAPVPEIEEIEAESGLTDKQQLFCIYYVKCFNATRAYMKAYGTEYPTSQVNGSKLLSKPMIREEILRLKKARMNREFIDANDIVEKFMEIAFSDITDYLEFKNQNEQVLGMFGPMEYKNPETGEMVQVKKDVNVVRFKDSNEIDGTLITEVKSGKNGASIKLPDKMKALEWLGNYFMCNPMDSHKIEYDKRKIELELIRIESQVKETEEPDGVTDNFVEALGKTAKEVWTDGVE